MEDSSGNAHGHDVVYTGDTTTIDVDVPAARVAPAKRTEPSRTGIFGGAVGLAQQMGLFGGGPTPLKEFTGLSDEVVDSARAVEARKYKTSEVSEL